jgi:lipopolysaccharide transport system permease protein
MTTWTENRPSTGWFPKLDLKELWRYRELLIFFAIKELKVRYKQTFFGVAWAVLQPVLAMAIFSIVFGRLADLPSDGVPYAPFVLAGLVIWLYVSRTVALIAESLIEDPALITKVYFPRVLAPLGAALPGLVDLGVSLVVLAIVTLIAGVTPGFEILLVPVWIVGAVLVALGPGLWLSALNVLYRDVRHIVPFLIQVWLFASPVVFPSSLFDGWGRVVYSLNPIVGVIDGFRWSFVDAPPPPVEDLLSLASAIVLLVGGFLYFRRVERQFADQI